MSDDNSTSTDTMALAAELTAAWLANPNTRASADQVPNFLRSTFQALEGLSGPVETPPADDAAPQEFTPAVSVRKSLANPDIIVSMIDGKPYKTLRRHLATNGLTPDQYRERYGLKSSYPMVAANYSESRRAMAKQIGLGRKPGAAQADDAGSASEQTQAAEPAPVESNDAGGAAEAPKLKRRTRKNTSDE